jgi:hypothetical protein
MPVFNKPTESTMNEALVSLLRSAASGITSGCDLCCAEILKVRTITRMSEKLESEDGASKLLTAVDKAAADMTRLLASREICISNMLIDTGEAIMKMRDSKE